ncbi:MAG TPA: hypothetical protein VEK76_02025 [Candidatus Binatia bacterium]|nr:hypothetical protein [Candidatus Binatia bacterium]
MSTAASDRHDDLGMDAAGWRAMAWYGWGSAVGLGLFLLLVSLAAASLIIAVHH